ncbi:formyltetrahydrofolate deformylase [Dysgonomonas hofstadii]|uniref:Formyltetrahydrofolate deformylase n=1 Tax=Dysgonomonas hofstadii TaxID=637886 RepID=A0A840CMP3_9BACT|nr:formyltetrahydrofolate deformylase [Dysgonomonas hofstadii]MBB4035959.1 formyltetrahydrofolate deformylase [Dysgonomonas hofstadii]
MNNAHAIILISSPDRPGLVAAVTDFINVNGGNIINLEQHVDKDQDTFFMRIEWDLTNFIIPREKISDYFQTMYANKYDMTFRLYFNDYTPRMAVFVSRMSHCLFDILARFTAGEWNVEIPLIVSNHEDMRWVADKFGIEYHVLKINKENKDETEAKQLALLKEKEIDFIVLARYMQILTDKFIESYPNKVINIHHSFLPAFVGAKPYHAAYERGVKIIGATSHYVTTELDAGPIIEQDITRITHRDSIENLVRKGQDLEKIVLSHAIEYHLNRRVLVYKNKTILFS